MKLKLFIDFDNTIVNTTKAAITIYNNFKGTDINFLDVENYNMAPYVDLTEKERSELFCQESLYNILEPFSGVYNILKNLKLSKLFEIYLVTNCSANSIPYKIKWLKNNNFDSLFDGKIYLDVGCQGYNKSIIDMSSGILIDDHRENHLSSNAKYKLSFQYNEKQKWGPEPQDGVIIFNEWDEGVQSYLEYIAKSHSGKYSMPAKNK